MAKPLYTQGNLVFLSNGYTSALENSGSIVWFPCVRFDSPSVFTKLLQEEKEGGSFSVYPKTKYTVATEYIKNSLVVRNNFKTARGELRVIDFLPHKSPSIMRLFESDIDFKIDIKPRFYYGKIVPKEIQKNNGIIFKNPWSRESLELIINGNYRTERDGTISMKAGKGYLIANYAKDIRHCFLYNGFSFSAIDPYHALRSTLNYWDLQCSFAKKVKNFSDAYYRSIVVSLGLMYEQSGAIIAAATTSLPEIIGGKRNWDYRYIWIRDASYAASAFSRIGLDEKAKQILNFMISVIDPLESTFKHPLYTVDGTEAPEESHLYWLSGYQNSRPVRVGNAAYMQTQRDTEGAFFDALMVYINRTKDLKLLTENWTALESVAEYTTRTWKNKSTSIWEERGYVYT